MKPSTSSIGWFQADSVEVVEVQICRVPNKLEGSSESPSGWQIVKHGDSHRQSFDPATDGATDVTPSLRDAITQRINGFNVLNAHALRRRCGRFGR